MHSTLWWPTVFVVLIATITDIRSRRIPNWLVFPFLLLGLLVSGVRGGWSGLGNSFLGILLATVVLGLFQLLGGMGMGDLKLCASIGAWIGPHQLGLALVLTGVAGGILAVVWALCGGFLSESLSGAGDLIVGLRKRGLKRHESLNLANPAAHSIPYAPAIAIGTILSFFANP